MKQVHLVRSKTNATVNRICWLDNNIKPEQVICFHNEKEKWTVKQVWQLQIDKCELNRGWHVGGL